jgi:hypothetical protein
MLEIYYGHNVSVYFFSSRGAPLPVVTLRVQQLRSSNTNTAHTMAVKGRKKKQVTISFGVVRF